MRDAIIELQVKLAFQADLTAKLKSHLSNQQQQIACLESALQALKEQTDIINSLVVQDGTKQDERPPHY